VGQHHWELNDPLCQTAPVLPHLHHHHPETVAARIDALMAAVFELDDALRLSHLKGDLATDFVFVTPSAVVDSAEGLSDVFSHYRHDAWRHASLRRSSPVEVHHGYLRFSWERVEGGQVAMAGWGFGQIDEEGRLRRLVTFDGMVPASEATERRTH
jgi:hypothetical protein